MSVTEKENTSESSVKVKTKKVTLKCSHTHGGKEYEKGDSITIRESQEQWLKDRKVI